MASISGRGAKGHHTYKLTLTEASTSTKDNTSSINYSFELIDDANWYWEQWGSSITYSISANGSVIKTGSIPNHTTKNQTIASGSFTVPHNADGTKTISYSFTVTDGAGQSYTSGNASASGTMELTNIPRYATVTQTFVSKTETSINYTWTSDSTIDYIWVSINNGSTWKGYDIADGKSSTLSLSSLSANTTYNIKTRVRRKDSQLTTDSTALSVTTYNYPHCTNSPNFIIGDALTLNFYNPLNRFITITGYNRDTNEAIFTGTITGTSVKGFNDANSVNIQYATIPNSKSGAYKVVVSYGSVAMTRDNGNTYSIRGTETPTINGFDYIDSNATTVALTGNNQHIIQNKSTLQARFHAATANYGAGGISQYYLECNGKTANGSKEGSYNLGTIDSQTNVDLKLTVVDSRGLSASKTIKVSMIAYNNPFAIVSLQRLNNYEDETYLTVDGSVSSVNGKNTMAIKYRYKQSGGSYGSYVSINDMQKYTFSLDKNNSFIFNVVVTDALGSTFSGEFALGKGVFPLFIDTRFNSVGINCFPTETNSLEVNGLNVYKIANNVNKSQKQILLGSNAGLTIAVNDFGGTDKITLIVAGADNSSMTPVFTVIHMRSGSGFGHINLGLNSTVTRDGNRMHIAASQWSHFTVIAPIGCDITLSNSAL